MSLEPDQVKGAIETAKPYFMGSLGAMTTFLWQVIEDKRKLSRAILLLWMFLGAMFASWVDDMLVWLPAMLSWLPFDVEVARLRAPILFFTGATAMVLFPKLRALLMRLFDSFAKRTRAAVEKSE